MAGEGRASTARPCRPSFVTSSPFRSGSGRRPATSRVEFYDGDSVMEDHSGTGLRQHRRFKPATLTPVVRGELRQDPREAGSRARRQPRNRRRRRRGAGVSSATRAHCLVHRVDRRRPYRVVAGGAVVQEGAPRDGRQERHHDHGRRQLDLAVEGCLWGGFGTSGQRCTPPAASSCTRKVYKPFLEQFVARTRALRVGDGRIRRRRWDRRSAWPARDGDEVRGDRQRRGSAARVRRPRADGRRARPRVLHEPTIFADVAPPIAHRAGRDLRAGRVGDSVAGRTRRDRDRQSVQYGLSASIYTRDVNRAFAAMRDMYNRDLLRERATIGGRSICRSAARGDGERPSRSRNGGTRRLLGMEAVYVDFSGKLQRAQIDAADI